MGSDGPRVTVSLGVESRILEPNFASTYVTTSRRASSNVRKRVELSIKCFSSSSGTNASRGTATILWRLSQEGTTQNRQPNVFRVVFVFDVLYWQPSPMLARLTVKGKGRPRQGFGISFHKGTRLKRRNTIHYQNGTKCSTKPNDPQEQPPHPKEAKLGMTIALSSGPSFETSACRSQFSQHAPLLTVTALPR